MMNLQSIIPWKREDQSPVLRREAGDPFIQLQRRMNGLFDDFLGRSSTDSQSGYDFVPHLEWSESAKEITVTAELPGLDEKDVEVTVTSDLLTIKGEKKEEKQEDERDYHKSERSYGYFERAIALPAGTDGDQVKAKFKKGILKVKIPKKPEAQSKRRKIELMED